MAGQRCKSIGTNFVKFNNPQYLLTDRWLPDTKHFSSVKVFPGLWHSFFLSSGSWAAHFFLHTLVFPSLWLRLFLVPELLWLISVLLSLTANVSRLWRLLVRPMTVWEFSSQLHWVSVFYSHFVPRLLVHQWFLFFQDISDSFIVCDCLLHDTSVKT